MSAPTRQKPRAVSGRRKAAILLLNLQFEQSAAVLKLLTEEQVQAIGETIAELEAIDPEQTEETLAEFVRLSGYTVETPTGGLGRARRMLAAAFGKEDSIRLTQGLGKNAQPTALPSMKSIERADPELLAGLLADEHPQTIALILGNMAPESSSAVLQRMQDSLRTEIAIRIARLEKAPPEVLTRIVSALQTRLGSFSAQQQAQEVGGVRVVADLLNRVQPLLAEEILTQMDTKDEHTATRIRDLLFVFENLIDLDAVGMRELIKRVDRKVLTVALKGTSEELQEYICSTMSKRGAEMLREDMDVLGPVKIRDVEAAQKQILEVAKEMEKEGTLSLSPSEADQYVQ